MGKTNMNVCLDSDLKEQFVNVCNNIGISMSCAVKMYVRHVITTKKVSLNSISQKNNVQFIDAYKQFLDECEILTGTPNYKKHLSVGKNWLFPFLEQMTLDELTCGDYQKCVNEAYNKGRSKKTLKNIKGSITRFNTFCRKYGYTYIDYIDVDIPKKSYKQDRRILQPEQLKMLLSLDHNSAGTDYIYAFQFILATGLRRGELCGLQRQDIIDDIVKVSRSVNSLGEVTDGKTENAQRYFKLYGTAKEIYDKQIALLKKKGIISPYVFPNLSTGGLLNPQYLFAQWREFRKSVDIECSIHELRHTFISITKCDIPKELIKMIVGHSQSFDTFGIYGHEVKGDLERAATMVDDIFKKLLGDT